MKFGTVMPLPFDTKITFAIAMVFVIVIAFPPTPSGSRDTDHLSFNIPSIGPNDRRITYRGDASVGVNGTQLTTNQLDKTIGWSTGRAVYNGSMHLWDRATGNTADFATKFSFTIDPQTTINDTRYADGMAFFLAPFGSENVPENARGGYLGLVSAQYPNPSTNGQSFVAIEFDTYINPWDTENPNDPNTRIDYSMPHVGIDINSMKSVNFTRWLWSNRTDRLFEASITYNSSLQKLSVAVTESSASDQIGAAVAQPIELSYIVQLKDVLPERVTFGFSAATGMLFELHTVHSWMFNSTLQLEVPRKSIKPWIWAVIGLSSFLVLGMIFILFHIRRTSKEIRSKELIEEEDEADAVLVSVELEKFAGPKKFSYEDLVKATESFSSDRQLGEGGFGKVYMGYLSELKSNVAIKKVTPNSTQGLKEFMAEVKAVSQLRHRSLVQLIGWCHQKRELLLIYEFMSNGSLDTHLFKRKSLLTWATRYKIAQDMASALLYLHEDWAQCVLHRDIKCSNILLDSSFNAKLGDFGLARLVDHKKGTQTTVLAGTFGYMAPECVYRGKASKESDVYSFGIVTLEIACGRKVFEPRTKEEQVRLVEWVWGLYGIGSLLEAADPELGIEFDSREMECLMIVGLWCAHPDFMLRPSMQEVQSVLKFDTSPPVLPLEMPTPTYSSPSINMSTLSLESSHSIDISRHSDTKSSTLTTTSDNSAASASSSSLWLPSNGRTV